MTMVIIAGVVQLISIFFTIFTMYETLFLSGLFGAAVFTHLIIFLSDRHDYSLRAAGCVMDIHLCEVYACTTACVPTSGFIHEFSIVIQDLGGGEGLPSFRIR